MMLSLFKASFISFLSEFEIYVSSFSSSGWEVVLGASKDKEVEEF